MLACSWIDLNIDQHRNYKTRTFANFEDGDFPALRFHYDRQVHAHHMATGHSTPQNRIPEFLRGRFLSQNNNCHSNLSEHKKWQLSFHPKTHCQWLNKHRRNKNQTQATISADLLKQSLALHPKNNPNHCQHYSSQQQQTHSYSPV